MMMAAGVHTLMDWFSILFYLACVAYVVFALYTLLLNPKGAMNIVFFAVCTATALWAFAFAMGNVATGTEDAFFWRRVATFGWGPMYSFLLHFFLLLTERHRLLKNKWTYGFIYVPSLINIVVFSLYEPLAKTQYNMVQIATGWINLAPKGLWDTYFNIYYIAFTLLGLLALWSWGKGATDVKKKRTALMISMTYVLSFGIGTLTDVIMNAYFDFKMPQLGVVFALITILGIYLAIKRHGLMVSKSNITAKEGELLGKQTRIQLFRYVSGIFIAGSVFNLAHFIYFDIAIESVLLFSAALLIIGAVVTVVPLTKDESSKQDMFLFFILALAMFLILMRFSKVYASNIVWPVSVLFMLLSTVFKKRLFLLVILITTLFAQWVSWLWVPVVTIQVTLVDSIARVAFYCLFGLLAYYINRIYHQRLIENERQTEVQSLLSELSADLVSADIDSLDEKITGVLEKSGIFFGVDRVYLVQMSDNQTKAHYTHEWCADQIRSTMEKIRKLPTQSFLWWKAHLKPYEVMSIADTTDMPKEARRERAILKGRQVKSLVCVPIVKTGRVMGFIGFDSVNSSKVWQDTQKEILLIIANVISDALHKVRSEKDIHYMAFYDRLTGLSNRALFKTQLEQALELAKRSSMQVGVLFLDLDDFKGVNDTLGHEAGDLLLKVIAEKLKKCVRSYDSVCRFGGDEFLVLFSHIKKHEELARASEKIISIFKDPLNVNGQVIHMTASAGVAVYPRDGQDSETLIKSADLAMYAAKDKGKNQLIFCSEAMKEAVNERMQLTNDLYRAIERNELILHYQPQIKICTGEIVGIEALIRWEHPQKGIIQPEEFIPLAEQTGLIHAIGDWVLRAACHQNRTWQDMGLKPVFIAVNLSVEQFRTPQVIDVIATVLNESNLAPEYLEIEITEGIAIHESDQIIPILNALKALGVAIAIDDFGTEYSSLSRLKEMPIDRIKMAMEFVHGIDSSTKDAAIATVIINLARSLNLRIIAEGVETKEQLDFLAAAACDEVQGYYLHQPMSPKAIEQLLSPAG